jgi:transposase
VPSPGPARHPRAPRPQGRPPLQRTADPAHRADLLTDKHKDRLADLFAVDAHVEVKATWSIYQRMITAYRDPDHTRGRELMQKLIDSTSHGVPATLIEVVTLGRTLKKRAIDILAYFNHPGTSNGPQKRSTAASNPSAGSALGFHNLTNYIARSLLETGGFRPRLHPGL